MKIILLSLLTLAACSKHTHRDLRKVSAPQVLVEGDFPFSSFTIEKNIISPAAPSQTNLITFKARYTNNSPITGLSPVLTINPEGPGADQPCAMTETPSNSGDYTCTVTGLDVNYNVSLAPGSATFVTGANRNIGDVIMTNTPFCYVNNALGWTNHKQSGAGTLANPYKICSAAQLKSLSLAPADFASSYELMIALDFSTFLSTAANEFSIGTAGNPFTGDFDGNDLAMTNYHATAANQGFFGVVSGGVIHNVNLSYNSSVTGGFSSHGGLIDSITTSGNVALRDVTLNGSLSCSALCSVGGLVGSVNITGVGQLVVERINSTMSSNSGTNISAVISSLNAPTATQALLSKINASLTVSSIGASSFIGTVVANAIGATISDAKASLTANVVNVSSIGGIAGSTNTSSISNSIAVGDVVSSGTISGAGGIMGQAESGTVLNNSVALVNMTGISCTGECGQVVGNQLAPISETNNFTSNESDFAWASINSENTTGNVIDTTVAGTPDYFADTTNAPYTSWDMMNVWESDYPNFPKLQFIQ